MPLEQHDGLPLLRLKTKVDAFGFGAHFLQKQAITLDGRAARRANLNEGEAAMKRGIQFQETLNAAETLENSLGVVDAVHSDTQERSFDAQLGAESRALLPGASRLFRRCAVFRERHANGIRAHARNVALAVHGEAVPFRESFDPTVHRLQEIVAMRLYLETNQVRAKQPVDYFALPRANSKHFRIRPRNVPEDSHPRIRSRFLDHPRQQCKVIILRQNDR